MMPEDGEIAGLLALMLLIDARRTARVSASGELIPLDQQDRSAWDAEQIAEGHRLVRERLAAGVAPGRYQILAAINAVRTSGREARETDWSQVLALYDHLVRLDPSPIIALNRAVAVAEIEGPEVALAAVDCWDDKLAGYHAYHVTRAELLRRLGRNRESREAYDRAIELAGNVAESAYLTHRRDEQLSQASRTLRMPPSPLWIGYAASNIGSLLLLPPEDLDHDATHRNPPLRSHHRSIARRPRRQRALQDGRLRTLLRLHRLV